MNCLTGTLTNYHIHRCQKCRVEFACTEKPKGQCHKKRCEICMQRLRNEGLTIVKGVIGSSEPGGD